MAQARLLWPDRAAGRSIAVLCALQSGAEHAAGTHESSKLRRSQLCL